MTTNYYDNEFFEFENESVLLCKNGVHWKTLIYYTSGIGWVFAKSGRGFLKLFSDGNTSQPGTTFMNITIKTIKIYKSSDGQLVIPPDSGSRWLELTKEENRRILI